MKKIYSTIGLLCFFVIVLEIINVDISNKVAFESIHVSKLESEIKKYEQKNNILRSRILQYTSYESVASRAAALGFVEPKEYISLYQPLEVAVKNGR